MYLKINYDDSKPMFEKIDFGKGEIDYLSDCYRQYDLGVLAIVPTVVSGLFMIVFKNCIRRTGCFQRYNAVATMLFGSRDDFIIDDAILCRVEGLQIVPLTDDDIKRVKRCFGWY